MSKMLLWICRVIAFAQRQSIAEGGIFTVRPPSSKIDEDDKRTIVDSGYVCPAFSNTHVGSSFILCLEDTTTTNIIKWKNWLMILKESF